jgi:ATP:corrinoid adenosyltransferase
VDANEAQECDLDAGTGKSAAARDLAARMTGLGYQIVVVEQEAEVQEGEARDEFGRLCSALEQRLAAERRRASAVSDGESQARGWAR